MTSSPITTQPAPTAPSAKERACYKIIKRYRKAQVYEEWGSRWPGHVAWVCSTLFERMPPAPETKTISSLLSAYSGDLRVKHVPSELLVELVTVLYGEDVARDLDILNRVSTRNKELWAAQVKFAGAGGSVSFVPAQEQIIRELVAVLPAYRS
jgi:hypothetical protein